MSVLYLDCGMGAADDMLLGALVELTDHPEKIIDDLNRINIPGVMYVSEKYENSEMMGTHVCILINEEHAEEHHCLDIHELEHIVNDLCVNDHVKADIKNVYHLIAEAESKVNGTTIGKTLSYDAGRRDTIAGVTGVCYLMYLLKCSKIYASAVNVGTGIRKCSQGILPVPLPVVAELVRGIPVYSRLLFEGELCTASGAALLKYYVNEFGDMPCMTMEKCGYGMGFRNHEDASCVRAIMGDEEGDREEIIELNFNVDDISAEELSDAIDILFQSGAKEVFTSPVTMKKSRLGVLVTVIVRPEDKQRIVRRIFQYTTTLGVRETINQRYILKQSTVEETTEFGIMRKKISEGYGTYKEKYEYEDLHRVSRMTGMSIHDILKKL